MRRSQIIPLILILLALQIMGCTPKNSTSGSPVEPVVNGDTSLSGSGIVNRIETAADKAGTVVTDSPGSFVINGTLHDYAGDFAVIIGKNTLILNAAGSMLSFDSVGIGDFIEVWLTGEEPLLPSEGIPAYQAGRIIVK